MSEISTRGAVVVLDARGVDDGVLLVEPARLEPLAAAAESEVVDLLATLFAAAADRRRGTRAVRRAA